MVKAPNSQPHTDIYHLLNLACFKHTGHYLPADGDETTKWKYRIVDGKKVAVMPRLNPRTILMPSTFHDFSKQVKLSMVVGELNSYFKPQPNEFKKLWEALERDLAKDRTRKEDTIIHHLCITHPKPDDFVRGICFELEYYNEDERYPNTRSMGSSRVIGGYNDLAVYYLNHGELPPQSLADLMGWMNKKRNRQVPGTHLDTRSTNPYKVAEAFEGKARGLPEWRCRHLARPVRDWYKRKWDEKQVEDTILHRVRCSGSLKYWAETIGRPKKTKQAWIDFYYDSIGKTMPCKEDWLYERWVYDQDDKREVVAYERRFGDNWATRSDGRWKNRDIFAELWKQEPQMDADDVMRIFAGVKGKSVEEKLVDYWC